MPTFPNAGEQLNATVFKPICPQLLSGAPAMSEDCLHLNIFSPNVRWFSIVPGSPDPSTLDKFEGEIHYEISGNGMDSRRGNETGSCSTISDQRDGEKFGVERCGRCYNAIPIGNIGYV